MVTSPSIAFPVSSISPDWFDREIVSRIGRTSGGEIIWLAGDEGEEIDFLLSRINSLEKVHGKHCVEIQVHVEDPELLWPAIFGGFDSPGLIHGCPQNALVLLFGASFLSEVALERLALPLHALASACDVCVVGGATYSSLRDHPRLLSSLGFDQFETKPFGSYPPNDLIELANDILKHVGDGRGVVYPENFGRRLIEEGRPRSRTELENWVRYYASSDDIENQTVPPFGQRSSLYPPALLTRDSLRGRFDLLRKKTDEINKKYTEWIGERLFKQVREQRHPFESGAAEVWFFLVLSYLSCLLHDAADEGLSVVKELLYSEDYGQIIVRPALPLYATVRSLRTRFQHALDFSSSHDRKTYAAASDWFINNCGKTSPDLWHWRRLTEKLLEEWEEAWLRLGRCLEAVRTSSNRNQLEAAIIQKHRQISKWQWLEIVTEALERINPRLDAEKVLASRIDEFQRQLKYSLVRTDEIKREAERIVENVVATLAVEPPVTAKDLIDAGIERGPRLGAALSLIRSRFLETPGATREELISFILNDEKKKK